MYCMIKTASQIIQVHFLHCLCEQSSDEMLHWTYNNANSTNIYTILLTICTLIATLHQNLHNQMLEKFDALDLWTKSQKTFHVSLKPQA